MAYPINPHPPACAAATIGAVASGAVCASGSCPAGLDWYTCQTKLERECGTAALAPLVSDCGFRVVDSTEAAGVGTFECDYPSQDSTAHSPLIGVAIDGVGIYGKWESQDNLPTLDACGGHMGPVPETTINSATYAAAANVYHYHVQDKAPFTLSCFGPPANTDAVRALYPSCEDPSQPICTSRGE